MMPTQTPGSEVPVSSSAETAAPSAWADALADPAVPLDLTGKRLHFVGIGGCGMSGLARMAAKRGACCTGSDLGMSKTVGQLRAAGIPVSLEQDGSAVPPELDLLVISAAIREHHPEVLEAVRRGAAVMKYAQLLGRLMVGRTGVAIAGTHGKSTTTSILSHILIQSGLDPSFIVGANCEQIGGGWRVSEKRGTDEALIAEACEYDRSFHNFSPTHATVLNVEADHLDLYSSIDEIVEAFKVFAQRVPEHGSLLVHHESPHRLALTAGLSCKIETIGFAPQADWRVEVVAAGGWAMGPGEQAGAHIKLWHGQEAVARWVNPMPGDHFAYNAAVWKLAELVRDGSLGKLHYLDAARLNLGLYREDVNVLWDLAAHDISITTMILGTVPDTVSAWGARHTTGFSEDVATLRMTFERQEVESMVRASWLDPLKIRKTTVVGSEKMAIYDDVDEAQRIKVVDRARTLDGRPGGRNPISVSYREGGTTAPSINFGEPLQMQANDFLDCCRTGGVPMSDGKAGLAVVAVLEASDRSLEENGAPIPVNLPHLRLRPSLAIV